MPSNLTKDFAEPIVAALAEASPQEKNPLLGKAALNYAASEWDRLVNAYEQSSQATPDGSRFMNSQDRSDLSNTAIHLTQQLSLLSERGLSDHPNIKTAMAALNTQVDSYLEHLTAEKDLLAGNPGKNIPSMIEQRRESGDITTAQFLQRDLDLIKENDARIRKLQEAVRALSGKDAPLMQQDAELEIENKSEMLAQKLEEWKAVASGPRSGQNPDAIRELTTLTSEIAGLIKQHDTMDKALLAIVNQFNEAIVGKENASQQATPSGHLNAVTPLINANEAQKAHRLKNGLPISKEFTETLDAFHAFKASMQTASDEVKKFNAKQTPTNQAAAQQENNQSTNQESSSGNEDSTEQEGGKALGINIDTSQSQEPDLNKIREAELAVFKEVFVRHQTTVMGKSADEAELAFAEQKQTLAGHMNPQAAMQNEMGRMNSEMVAAQAEQNLVMDRETKARAAGFKIPEGMSMGAITEALTQAKNMIASAKIDQPILDYGAILSPQVSPAAAGESMAAQNRGKSESASFSLPA